MSAMIKDWSITALCLSVTLMLWFAANPTTLGYWDAKRAIAYDSVWTEYVADCDCTEPLE